jgi:asparagine synthase (glutamine-hydrolysing)
MTGVVGGIVSKTDLTAMVGSITHEPWHESDRFEAGEYGVGLVHHDSKDPAGWTTWRDGNRAGVVHGAIIDGEANRGTDDVLEAILTDPAQILPQIDGPFVIACIDAETDRVVLATDKIGSRPCYYSLTDDLSFGSGLPSLLKGIDSPSVDEQAVSDMLLMGYIWGEKTLIEGIHALPPASMLEYSGGEVSIEKYWRPDFTSLSTTGYISELVTRYRDAIADVSTTMDKTAGLWLSGGLDSRTMAAELQRNAGRGRSFDTLTSYTYDANPPDAGNPELARQVAAALNIEIEQVAMTPDRFLENVEKSIDLTDGMLRWASFMPLTSVFGIESPDLSVLVEGSGQGELLGNHPQRYDLTAFDSAAEAMYHSERIMDGERVKTLLNATIDPHQTFTNAAQRSKTETREETILNLHLQNYYSRMTFASNVIPRSQYGTRVPFAHGNFLDYVTKLPVGYRMRAFPFTNGKIHFGITQPKLGLAQALNPELARIKYERTGVAPVYPYPIQVAGFVATTALARLRSQSTYGGQKLFDEWYRENEDIRSYIDGLIDDACERPLFNADEIRRLQHEHMSGEERHLLSSLSAITTVEQWLQRHID